MGTNRAAELPPQLERRPEAKAFQIDELLPKVQDGKVRVPPFQRGLKWEDPDRLDLFDSIYRGYPIGTLLLWQREAPPAQIKLGKLTIDAPARGDALWVVDGQQRITTLGETLLERPTAGDRAIHFDLEAGKFLYIKMGFKGDGVGTPKLPMSVVLDSNKLLEWLFAYPGLSTVLRGIALDVGKRIREYQIPSYIVETANEQVLRTIFHRTNRKGRELEETDVFNALFGSLSPEQPSDLRHLALQSLTLGFGALAESDVLHALLAVQGIPLDRDFTTELSREETPQALRDTSEALREAIFFLRRDAGIPHAALLPYALPIVVLSKFFHEFPTPKDRSRLLLRRWLWRGALGARLTGATVGMRQHLACIRENDEEGSVQRLLGLAGTEPAEDILRLDSFHFATAKSKLQCCALAALGPCNILSGEPIDIPSLFSVDVDEKVATVLRGKLAEDNHARGLANRILHPRLSTQELVKAITTSTSDAVLSSHAITRAAQLALKNRDVARFLEFRETSLRKVIGDYFRRQAEWGADDSPSLDSMIVDED